MELTHLSIVDTADCLAKKEFSAVEITDAYLERIKKLDTDINSYITVDEEGARKAAAEADAARSRGENGALLGVPLAIKDILQTVGMRMTAASKMLENYEATFDATAVQKLRTAGAVFLGKTNLDEFAHGASTENSAFGVTKNPWDTSRVPGGSSGGSAAAVAADLCAGSLGTDTGGSIRHPAAFCGIVGLKTSYGRVSRSGLSAMTSSTDVIGPMTKSVADAAILLDVIAGPDKLDQTSYFEVPATNQYLQATKSRHDLKGLKFGIPRGFVGTGLNKGVEQVFAKIEKTITEQGGEIVDVELPTAKYGVAAYYVITPSEISSNLARLDGIRYGHQTTVGKNLYEVYAKSRGEGFGAEAKRRIMVGTYALSHGYYDAYYKQAQRVRTLITRELEQVLSTVDFILTPSAPHVAFKIGAQVADPLQMYLEDIFMSPASLAGLPALSLPSGFAKPTDGEVELPVGMQFIGRRFDEAGLLAAGQVLENVLQVKQTRPQI